MAQPKSSIGQTITDYDKEKSTYSVTVVDITAANYAAQTTLYIALFNGVAGLTLGNVAKQSVVASVTEPDVSIPTNNLAQREVKWLVRYHDTSGRKFRVELPTADLSLRENNSEFLDLTGTEAAAFVDAFEAVAVSPADQSAVVVDSIQSVGRNS